MKDSVGISTKLKGKSQPTSVTDANGTGQAPNQPAHINSPVALPALSIPKGKKRSASEVIEGANKKLHIAEELIWSHEMTVAFLEYLVEAVDDGKLEWAKKQFMMPALEEIQAHLETEFPHIPFTTSKLHEHWKRLKRRHTQFRWFVDQGGGPPYDPVTGRVNATERQWKLWDRVFGKHGLWLRSDGLPRPDLHDFVFHRDTNESNEGVEPFNIIATDSILRRDNELAAGSRAGSNESQNKGQELPSPVFAIHSPRPTLSTTTRRTSDMGDLYVKKLVFMQSVMASLIRGRQEVGATDIRAAMRDAREVFGLQGHDLLRFSDVIRRPFDAVIWNALDLEAKKLWLKHNVPEILGQSANCEGGMERTGILRDEKLAAEQGRGGLA